jgi:type I restriction enzyme M protein
MTNDELREGNSKLKIKNLELERSRTEQSFLVPRSEIVENAYDLSINRYKEIVYEEVQYDEPQVILDRIDKIEAEITADLAELRGMIS